LLLLTRPSFLTVELRGELARCGDGEFKHLCVGENHRKQEE